MRKLLAMALVVALLVGVTVPATYAGTATNVALGLASFAVFNQVVGGFVHPAPSTRTRRRSWSSDPFPCTAR